LIPSTHQKFFNDAVFYYEQDGMLFVHGGIIPDKPMEEQTKFVLTWDRDLIQHYRAGYSDNRYKKIFIGHTTTQLIGSGSDKPIIYNNDGELICMDVGAGWSGKLAIMDIHTEEYWLSKKQNPATGRGE
jgi:hypothetical protein